MLASEAPAARAAPAAVETHFAELYAELRRRAHRLLRPGSGPTLQPTALVHEAWARVVGARPELCASRADFLAYAASAMRSILIDYERRRRRRRRAEAARTILDAFVDSFAERAISVVDLDAALAELARFDAPMARAAELRFFAGLDVRTIAGLLGMPKSTLEKHWKATLAWLHRRLS